MLLPGKQVLCEALVSTLTIYNWDSDAYTMVVPSISSMVSPTPSIYRLIMTQITLLRAPPCVVGGAIHIAVPVAEGIVGVTLPVDPTEGGAPSERFISRTKQPKYQNVHAVIHGYRRSIGTELKKRQRTFLETTHSWTGEVNDQTKQTPLPPRTRELIRQDWVYGDEFSNTLIFFDWKKGEEYLHKTVYW